MIYLDIWKVKSDIMHRNIEIDGDEKKIKGTEEHIITAKTLSEAAEVSENLDKRCEEIHKVMKKYSFRK